MAWITPIFDRIVSDTVTARANQANEDNNKGALNYQDLNRIEGNHKYLMERLENEGYHIGHVYRNYTETEVVYADDGSAQYEEVVYTEWFEKNIPWKSEIDRIRRNFNLLLQQYLFGKSIAPIVSSDYLGYAEVNKMEELEQTTDDMIDQMTGQYRLCNTFNCGEGR